MCINVRFPCPHVKGLQIYLKVSAVTTCECGQRYERSCWFSKGLPYERIVLACDVWTCRRGDVELPSSQRASSMHGCIATCLQGIALRESLLHHKNNSMCLLLKYHPEDWAIADIWKIDLSHHKAAACFPPNEYLHATHVPSWAPTLWMSDQECNLALSSAYCAAVGDVL